MLAHRCVLFRGSCLFMTRCAALFNLLYRTSVPKSRFLQETLPLHQPSNQFPRKCQHRPKEIPICDPIPPRYPPPLLTSLNKPRHHSHHTSLSSTQPKPHPNLPSVPPLPENVHRPRLQPLQEIPGPKGLNRQPGR